MPRRLFISPFIDYENRKAVYFGENIHRFQHQIFQEFFAASGLYELYRDGLMDKLLTSLQNLTISSESKARSYMPEVGRFFSEMIELNAENTFARDFAFWQNLLLAPGTDDWVRTYALQVRDMLGDSKAKDLLDNLFGEENRSLNLSNPEDSFIRILPGTFVFGSYEDPKAQPVRLFSVDEAYEIARYPVTKKEFKEFIDDRIQAGKDAVKEGANKLFEPNTVVNKIKLEEREFVIEKGFEKHPMTAVSWYGAQAYCDWRRKRDGDNWCLPTEEQWEAAARGWTGTENTLGEIVLINQDVTPSNLK